jgi:hypothetical protein
MTIYIVNGKYRFTHYGKALSFANRIGGVIKPTKTYNPIAYLFASI